MQGINESYGSSWIDAAHAFLGQLDSVESAMEDWLAIGKAVGCLGAYIYLMRAYSIKTLKGEPFLVADFINPILIALLLSVYTPVAKGLQSLFLGTNDASEVIDEKVGEMLSITSKIDEEQLENEQDIEREAQSGGVSDHAGEVLEEKSGEDGSSLFDQAKYLMTLASNPMTFLPNLVKAILTSVLNLMLSACLLIIYVLSALYIKVLYIFGPFSIGISIIPGFENSISNWFQKYITYCLWIPIANTVTTLLIETYNAYLSGYGGIGATNAAGLIMFMVIGIIIYLSVPKLASNILALGASQSFTRGVAAKAAGAASKALTKGAL
ncbi:type IV secretion system protein [Parapedobacter sp. 10938]|uniref:type IV secretion system protein n=1 Tax=Parapedobacter flavus TaxID=3110225 RepID=UPI002DB9D47C|nr:type IV secretion system protein [Parapedobacter sp. 10938]MEC3881831.1 type IV secretion system protein [Parapedobacter sp. 10938]